MENKGKTKGERMEKNGYYNKKNRKTKENNNGKIMEYKNRIKRGDIC